MAREGSLAMTWKQKPEGNEKRRHSDTQGKNVLGRIARAKPQRELGVFVDSSGAEAGDKTRS